MMIIENEGILTILRNGRGIKIKTTSKLNEKSRFVFAGLRAGLLVRATKNLYPYGRIKKQPGQRRDGLPGLCKGREDQLDSAQVAAGKYIFKGEISVRSRLPCSA